MIKDFFLNIIQSINLRNLKHCYLKLKLLIYKILTNFELFTEIGILVLIKILNNI